MLDNSTNLSEDSSDNETWKDALRKFLQQEKRIFASTQQPKKESKTPKTPKTPRKQRMRNKVSQKLHPPKKKQLRKQQQLLKK